MPRPHILQHHIPHVRVCPEAHTASSWLRTDSQEWSKRISIFLNQGKCHAKETRCPIQPKAEEPEPQFCHLTRRKIRKKNLKFPARRPWESCSIWAGPIPPNSSMNEQAKPLARQA